MSNYRKSLKVYEPPECFKDGFDSFINSLKPRSLKEATIYKYRRDCTFMLTSPKMIFLKSDVKRFTVI